MFTDYINVYITFSIHTHVDTINKHVRITSSHKFLQIPVKKTLSQRATVTINEVSLV